MVTPQPRRVQKNVAVHEGSHLAPQDKQLGASIRSFGMRAELRLAERDGYCQQGGVPSRGARRLHWAATWNDGNGFLGGPIEGMLAPNEFDDEVACAATLAREPVVLVPNHESHR